MQTLLDIVRVEPHGNDVFTFHIRILATLPSGGLFMDVKKSTIKLRFSQSQASTRDSTQEQTR